MRSSISRTLPLVALTSIFACGDDTPATDQGTTTAMTETGDGDPGDGDPGDGDPGPSCGDGVLEGDEECDDANADDTDACTSMCLAATCGDGFVQTDVEGCDDANNADGDGCAADCLVEECGDGVVAGVEQCDDANADDTDDCTSMCLDAACGDGFVHAGVEDCDDANMDDTDDCTSMCLAATCGDGFVQAGVEDCDDANMDDTDDCVAGCVAASCGDGFVQAGVEGCDDANMDDTDACTNACQLNPDGLSCKDILTSDPNAPDGVYLIDPDGDGGDAPRAVLCDMSTDEGGWTMVASSRMTTLEDEASAYYDDLQTINPVASHTGIWTGMRALVNGGNSDIRFTCMADPDANALTVDLSFYDIIWYDEITTGTDLDSCFSENDGMGDDQPTPARRDNISNQTRPVNDQWNTSGYLEGEDGCGSTDDFTVDFDDRGIDSNQSDGTDWGEDDTARKCGMSSLATGAWHIWVREL